MLFSFFYYILWKKPRQIYLYPLTFIRLYTHPSYLYVVSKIFMLKSIFILFLFFFLGWAPESAMFLDLFRFNLQDPFPFFFGRIIVLSKLSLINILVLHHFCSNTKKSVIFKTFNLVCKVSFDMSKSLLISKVI